MRSQPYAAIDRIRTLRPCIDRPGLMAFVQPSRHDSARAVSLCHGTVARLRLAAWMTALALGASTWIAAAATINESFASDPLLRGWKVFGDASLFQWNRTNENVEVTWDSSRTNSYFWLPLGTILSRGDDFSIAFDLRLRDIAIGTTTNKSYTFEIAAGLLRMTNATATNFFRGAGQSSLGPRNLVEFDYFPDSGFGATFSPTVVTTNKVITFSDNHPLEMTAGDLFHIVMSFTASNRTLRTIVTKNGAPFGLPPTNAIRDLVLTASQDFRVDAVAIMSYSDAVQVGSPTYWGSVLAHGTLDNLVVTVPDPPVQVFTLVKSNATVRAQFATRTNWLYTLERTRDFTAWAAVSSTNDGTGAVMTLVDTNASVPNGYYRVRAIKP